jgi:hypothetical protein
MTGLTIAVPEQEWASLAHASPESFAQWLLAPARQVDPRKRVKDDARAEETANPAHSA